MTLTAFKGFDKDMRCRDFQYEEGGVYEHDGEVALCSSGFHAVTMPLDALRYYHPRDGAVYHRVELEDVDPARENDSKVAARKIKIGARLDLPGLIGAQVEFVLANSKPVPGGSSDKPNTAVKAESTNGAATASGCSGAATASGCSGAATASGYYGAATASGYYGAATASGRSGAATASGYYGAATASGRSGAATASGEKSVAVVTGREGRASGALNSWLVLTERDADWNILGIKPVRVDGKRIKPDTFYILRAGKITEADQ